MCSFKSWKGWSFGAVRGMELIRAPCSRSRPLRSMFSPVEARAGTRGVDATACRNWWNVCAHGSARKRCMASVPIPEHRPEAAWRRVHELRFVREAAGRRAGDTCTSTGRSWTTCRGLCGYWTSRLCWLGNRCAAGKDGWILEQGPERIESGWWDGKGVARDYYIARSAPAQGCGFFGNGNPSAGICTGCSLEWDPGCTPNCMP